MVPASTEKTPRKRQPLWLFSAQYYGRSLWLSLHIPWRRQSRGKAHPGSLDHHLVSSPHKEQAPFLGFGAGSQGKTLRFSPGRLVCFSLFIGLCCLFLGYQMLGPAVGLLGNIGLTTGHLFLASVFNPLSHQTSQINASKTLVRISQLDPAQYKSSDEYTTWAYSACSSAALTEIFNAYGRQYRVTDVLAVEAAIGEITPQLGLMEDVGIAKTAAKFGFQTNWGDHWTLAQVLSNANAGRPVLVGWPPDRYEGGHIVVVIGGDADTIFLADTSRWNRHSVSVQQFVLWWAGFAAVITPV